MVDEIQVAGWTLVPETTRPRTVDGRFSFERDSFGDRWTIYGQTSEAVELVNQLGLDRTPISSSLRETVKACADLTGCEPHIRHENMSYEIREAMYRGRSAFTLRRHGRTWYIGSTYYASFWTGTSYHPWREVNRDLSQQAFKNRTIALDALTAAMERYGVTL